MGLHGNDANRKSWGYWQRVANERLIPLLVVYGHSTQLQTLQYPCIQNEKISNIYGVGAVETTLCEKYHVPEPFSGIFLRTFTRITKWVRAKFWL